MITNSTPMKPETAETPDFLALPPRLCAARGGAARALHVEDALAVIEKIPEPLSRRAESDPAQGMLAKCGFFTVYHKVGAFSMTAGTESFVHLLCLDGSATLEWREGKMSVRKGESVFIPAGLGNFSMSDGADIIVSAL